MVGAISRQNDAATGTAASPHQSYFIRSGDTLSAIAARHGLSLRSVIAANLQISDPDRIFAGQTLSLPAGGHGAAHTVSWGQTLSGIAAAHGVSVAEMLRANPAITNADRIYPGQQLTIPGQTSGATGTALGEDRAGPMPSVARAAPVRGARLDGGTLALTAQDIADLKKTLQTEWVQSAGVDQAHGIIDTMLNRQASGHWGRSVADVVNARSQFSDVNGPIAWRAGRNSVSDLPMARVSARVDQLVDSYLAARAAGQPSSIGSHLNYANPNYSSHSNLGWIMALDGPVLGRGDAIHRHGTTPDLERYRPGAFVVGLP